MRFIVLGLLALACSARAQPNIIFILADDFGWGDIACYGGKHVPTPNLDRMATQGVRFTQAYAAAPICSPSRAGLITGQYPGRWRITSFLQTRAGNKACEQADFLDPKAPSLPAMLKAGGYTTAHIGKWHLGGGRDVVDPPRFAQYGYDVGLGTYESPEPAAALGSKTTPWENKLEPNQVPRHQRTLWMIDQTLEFVRKRNGKPAFVNLWLDDTHTPFRPSEEQLAAVKPKDPASDMAKYRAVLFEMDRQIGRLLEGLKDEKDTLVIFMGDNGALPTFNQSRVGGLRGSKLSLYEGGIRVPLIAWRAGKINAGLVNEETIISGIDMLPMLCKIAGVPLLGNIGFDGEDLSAALMGENVQRGKPLFWEYGRNDTSFAYPRDAQHRSPNLAMREGKWKLVVSADGARAELFDIIVDRNETTELAASNPDIVKRMKEATLAWRKTLP